MMSKYYSPRDYDVVGYGGNRRFVKISDEEHRKRAKKKTKKNKSHEHYRKDWDKDLWD